MDHHRRGIETEGDHRRESLYLAEHREIEEFDLPQ